MTIQSEEERQGAAQELEDLMDAIGREAQEKGLTPEIASEILGRDIKPIL